MAIRWDGKQLKQKDNTGLTDDSESDLTGSLRQGYELGSLTDGLVAYFPFDGTVEDKALSNNGTDNTSADYVSGKVGSEAKDFDGEDDVITEIGDLDTFSFIQNTAEFCLTGWVNGNGDFLGNEINQSDKGFLTTVQSDGDVRHVMYDGSGSKTIDLSTSSQPVSTTSWDHIAVTGYGSNIKIFVNGNEEASESVSRFSSGNSSRKLEIGYVESYSAFEGQIDDVRVYDRPLSKPEIQALYNRTSTQKITDKDRLTSGLVGHWPLNEDNTSNAFDLSGNENDATSVTGTNTAVGLGGAKARELNGSDGRIDLPSITLDNTSGGLSFGAFVRPRFDTTSASGVTIWRWKSGGSNNTGFDWGEHHGGGGDLNFEWSDDGLQYDVPENWQNQWKHLFFVADDQDPVNLKIFVDGQEVASGGVGGNQTVNASSTSYIGVGDGYAFDMSDFRIYNRSLSKSEIEELARQGGL